MQTWIITALIAAIVVGVALHAVLARVFPAGGLPTRKAAVDASDRIAAALSALSDLVARIFPQSRSKRRALSDRLAGAGWAIGPDAYRARSVAFAAIGALCGALVSTLFALDLARALATCALCCCAGALAPAAMLRTKTTRRREAIDAQLPSALEMLSACVRAGLSMERSLDLVSERTEGEVSDEFRRCVSDITQLGYSTPEAMRKMDERCQVPSMTLFCASVAQAISQGSAIGTVLSSQAKIARRNHFAAIEERANKIPTKMAIPLVCLILPCTVIVSLAPAAMQIMSTFSGM